MQACAMTDVGRIRTHNQDFIYSSSEPVGSLPNLFIVADGMGGHKAGDYASRFVVEHLTDYVRQAKGGEVVPMLKEGIRDINRQLYSCSVNSEELSGMGTTLVAATVVGKTLYVANVGDSRLYLLRDHVVSQVTRDHSYVEEMVALGQMVRGSKDYQEKKNIITRAMGADEEIHADFFSLELKPGDYFLMCSDGLSNMVSEDEMGWLIYEDNALEAKVTNLIAAANDHGGKDNIAAILVEPQISEVNPC